MLVDKVALGRRSRRVRSIGLGGQENGSYYS